MAWPLRVQCQLDCYWRRGPNRNSLRRSAATIFLSVIRLTILITEAIRSPHTALAIGSMDGVDETVADCFRGVRPLILRVGQESRRHTGPEGKDDKGNQVAHCHGPPPPLVYIGPKSGNHSPPSRWRYAFGLSLVNLSAGPGCGEVVEYD